MFEVTGISGRLPSKLVELEALEEMTGVHRLLSMGRFDSKIYECAYHFPAGTRLILEFAPWRRVELGDRIDVPSVLRHPSVEHLIFKNVAKRGWVPAGVRKPM